jgi:hypothetical protein
VNYTDVRTQRGMMISPHAWQRFLKPRMAEFIFALKDINPKVKVAYHSDGTLADATVKEVRVPLQRSATAKVQAGNHQCLARSVPPLVDPP